MLQCVQYRQRYFVGLYSFIYDFELSIGFCCSEINAPARSNPAATSKLMPISLKKSPISPAPYGPIVCAIAKTTVKRLIALAQLSGGKFFLVKLVTAPGAIKTDNPNTKAESRSVNVLFTKTGSADPVAIHVKIKANGMPEAYRVRIGPQINGEMQILEPSITHIKVMKLALAKLSVIQADKKVR